MDEVTKILFDINAQTEPFILSQRIVLLIRMQWIEFEKQNGNFQVSFILLKCNPFAVKQMRNKKMEPIWESVLEES